MANYSFLIDDISVDGETYHCRYDIDILLFNCVMCSDVYKDKLYTWHFTKVRGSA